MSHTLPFLNGGALDLTVLRNLLQKTDLSLFTKRLLTLKRAAADTRMKAVRNSLPEGSLTEAVFHDAAFNDEVEPGFADDTRRDDDSREFTVSANRSADIAYEGHIPVNAYKLLLYVLPVHSNRDLYGARAGEAILAGRLSVIVRWEEKLLGSG